MRQVGRDDHPRRRLPGGKTSLIAAAAAVTVLVGGGAAFALTGSDDDGETATVAPARAAPRLAADAMRGPSEAQTRRMVTDRAARAARRDAARRPVLAVRGTPPPEEKKTEPPAAAAPAGNPVPAGEAQRIAKALLPKYGFNPDTQFGCLVNLWNRESHWNVHAGSPGGPYGIPQANPGSKMASAGSDWLNSASTQINWGLGYIKGRYGGPCDAWSHFQSAGWYYRRLRPESLRVGDFALDIAGARDAYANQSSEKEGGHWPPSLFHDRHRSGKRLSLIAAKARAAALNRKR